MSTAVQSGLPLRAPKEVSGTCVVPWDGDTSNKPFEWTGHHQLSAPPPPSALPATQGQRSKDQDLGYDHFNTD